MPTVYTITLFKKEEKGLPITTPFKVGKKTYEDVYAILYKAWGGKMQR